jgi:hypothetical protein
MMHKHNVHPLAMNSLRYMMLEYICSEYYYKQSVMHDVQTQMFILLLWTVYGIWCWNTNVQNTAMNSLWYMMHKHKCSSYYYEQSIVCDAGIKIFRILHEQSVVHDAWIQMFILLLPTVYGTCYLSTKVQNIAMNSLWYMMLEYTCSSCFYEQSLVYAAWLQLFIILPQTVYGTCYMSTNVQNIAMNSLWYTMLEYTCSSCCYEQSMVHAAWLQLFIILPQTVYGTCYLSTTVHNTATNSLWYIEETRCEGGFSIT